MARRPWLLVCALLVAGPGVDVYAAEPDWSAYGTLLERHVSAGARGAIRLHTVDYRALQQDPLFAGVMSGLESYPSSNLTTDAERRAFLLNAYNILALRMVLDHWPVASIKDAGNGFRPVWEKPAGTLDGTAVSLAEIEHERLRKMGDPRIHMAIVCASVSCPDLRREPYRAEILDAQLDDQTRRFLDNPGKGLRIDGREVHVSKIFKWFGEDFTAAGGVTAFIRRYHALPADAVVIPDIDYDWSLNGR